MSPRREPDATPLPNVTQVAFVFVTYDEPRLVPSNGTTVSFDDAVEIWVQMDGPIPTRAVSPALLVGSIPITNCRSLDSELYVFTAYEHQNLNAGDALALTWSAPGAELVTTTFVYQPPPSA